MEISTPVLMSCLGFLCGAGLGAVTRRIKFCTFGAIEDAVFAGRIQRLKIWLLAIITAIIITQLFRYFDNSRIPDSFYLITQFSILGAVLGGLLFGFGMSLVGTCAYGSLVRLGGGDLRALVVAIIIGLTAYMTMRGVTGLLRVEIIEKFSIHFTSVGSQGIPEIISYISGVQKEVIYLLAAIIGLSSLAVWLIKDSSFSRSLSDICSGVAVGALIAVSFIITATIGNDPYDPQRVESLAYVRPLGETLVYLMTYSGAVINFSIGTIFGTLFGAFAVSYFCDEIRLEAFDDAVEMKRHLLGAALMGIGAVTASGCTIGQGISAMAVLSINAPVALLSIFLGAVFGLHYLLSDNLSEAFEGFSEKVLSIFAKKSS